MAILTVQGVSRRFGGFLAVDNVSLQVEPGEILGLIGPNGAGKTTLFHLVSGVLRPTTGRIRLANTDLVGRKPHAICRLGIGRTFQIVQPYRTLSVLDNVAVGAFVRTGSRPRAYALARETLAFLGLEHRAGALAGTLTLAQKKRLEVARALATQPRVLLLDEVMAGLNPTETDEMVEVLRRLQRSREIAMVAVEHVMRVIVRLANRLVVLDRGRKIAEGKPDAVLADPRVVEAYLGEDDASA